MESVKSQKLRIRNFLNVRFRKPKSTDDILEAHLEWRIRNGIFVEGPTFRHTPFLSSSHVRLLTISPGPRHEELKCSLQQRAMAELNNDFVALSYAWGNGDHLLPICCDGAIVYVGVNLYSAMLRARHLDHSVLIWIDALCIDQGKDADALRERASQVRIMDKIYSSARLVMVDLGGCNEVDLSCLMKVFERIISKIGKDRGNESIWKAAADDVKTSMAETSFWSVLVDFARRPWFQRTWVLQELVLAKNVIMRVADYDIPPDDLHAATTIIVLSIGDRFVSNRLYATKHEDQAYHDVVAMTNSFAHMTVTKKQFDARHVLRDAGVQSLLDLPVLLYYTSLLEASDARDHIYALMGIMTDLNLSNFAIDYNEDGVALARRFAGALIAQGFGICCLSMACGTNEELSSWVPPLSVNREFQTTSLLYGITGIWSITKDVIYNACGNTRLDLRVCSVPSILESRAMRIDNIEAFSLTGAYMKSFVKTNSDVSSVSPLLVYEYLYTWAPEYFKDWEESLFWGSFWRTIILDYASGTTGIFEGRGTRVTEDMQENAENFHRMVQEHRYISAELRFSQLTQAERAEHLSAKRFYEGFITNSMGKKLCRTRHGRMAMIPAKSTHDNEIWIILGFPVPFVLRRLGDHHVIVGQCYVHGVMDGEAMNLPGNKVETIYLR